MFGRLVGAGSAIGIHMRSQASCLQCLFPEAEITAARRYRGYGCLEVVSVTITPYRRLSKKMDTCPCWWIWTLR